MLSSARRSLEALGHTHGLLETDLFSAIVELSAGQPGDAERLLRHAYDGFVARGVGVDAANAAALLARAVQAQGRVDEALALTEQSERPAGVDVRAAIWWRTARAEALAQKQQHAEALALAREAVALAEPTDALLDRAAASASLARVLKAAGDEAAAEREAGRALEQFERKGASALVSSLPQMLGSGPNSHAESIRAAVVHRWTRPNGADELYARGSQLSMAGDFDAWGALFSEDFVDVDHFVHITNDRERFLALAHRFAAPERARTQTERELLASLGDRHALARYTYRFEGAALSERSNATGPVEFIQLQLECTNSTGLANHLERFKADDLHLAVARLIELHADDELPPDRRPLRYMLARQFREKRARWSDDIVLVDHRPAGLWTLQGRDRIKDASVGLRDLSADLRWRAVDILGLTERFALLELVAEGHDDDGGPLQFRVIVLNEHSDDGLMQRSELYGADQVDEALDRFDHLVAGVALGGWCLSRA
jgi:tetratricopeptide (TPR) repeat protein